MANRLDIRSILFGLTLLLVVSCQKPGGESPGSEYMPDMAHSVAYEANYYDYYYYNTWGTEDEYYKMAKPRKPVAGTIARSKTETAPTYHYGDSEDERNRATAEIVANPYPITDAGLADAKELYTIYCGICHGEKGDGAGYLVREDGGVYPVQPANLLLEEFVNASNGRMYHAIMYGKNMMGAYKDKLKYEERWQVIHYIRSLQAKELKKEYNETANTLNNVEVPAATIAVVETIDTHTDEAHHKADDAHHDNSHH